MTGPAERPCLISAVTFQRPRGDCRSAHPTKVATT